jgi:Pyruvate/2-oxoacid:ferredoxin oxidoreductase delta subunit
MGIDDSLNEKARAIEADIEKGIRAKPARPSEPYTPRTEKSREPKCPTCWIFDGIEAALQSRESTDQEDVLHCKRCVNPVGVSA